MDLQKETNVEFARLKRLAFISVTVSTCVVFCSIVTLPLMYSYAQALHSHVTNEIDFCRIKSRDLWVEVSAVDMALGSRQAGRTDARVKREWSFGKWTDRRQRNSDHSDGYGTYPPAPTVSPPAIPQYGDSYKTAAVEEFQPSCCTCQQGPVGPPGPPGDDGNDGLDGKPGIDGFLGRDGALLAPVGRVPEPCTICPTGAQGPAGYPGLKGPPGPRGSPGLRGQDGKKGEAGMLGQQGCAGRPGLQGPKGSQGESGKIITIPGPAGPAGPSGPPGPVGRKGDRGLNGLPGPQGPTGAPGDVGAPGPDGKEGIRGERGPSGAVGAKGSCDHCPLPRLPPGY